MAASLAFVVLPIATFSAPVPAEEHTDDALRQELRQLRVAIIEDAKLRQQLTRRMNGELESASQTIAQLHTEVRELQRQVTALKQERMRVEGTLEHRLNLLAAQLKAETQQRNDADRALLREVLAEFTEATIQTTTENGAKATGSGRVYTVAKGDTLGAIARAFAVPLEKLMELNALKSDVIQIGQQLKIPSEHHDDH